MSEAIETDSGKGNPGFGQELLACWRQQPLKGVFLVLLGAWVALFHFLGNSTLGYVSTSSLFDWWAWVFTRGAREDANWLEKIIESDDSFAWFVPLIVLGLYWWKRRELQKVSKDIWWPALGLFLAAILLHLVGFVVQQGRISFVAFVLGGFALTGLVWGWAWMRATLFPYCLLAFCVPLGNSLEAITFPLRILATKISVAICHWVLWIDVIREGTRIWNRAHTFEYEVAVACSGIRSLTAFLAFSTIFSFIYFRKNWKRLVLIGSAFPLSVASNVLRLLMIIIAGEQFGQQAGNRVHESGWMSLLPYVVAIAGIFLLAKLMKEDPKEVAA